MSLPLLIAIILVSGAATGLQAPTNAMLSRALGVPLAAALVSFLVGTILLAVVLLASGARPAWASARTLPWYAFLGGAYGAMFVTIAAYAAPRIGVGATLILLVAGQLVAATLIDSFGLFGLARQAPTLPRLAGLALVVIGVVLARRG